MLGFRVEGKYTEWKYFNAKVLKPAIQNINSYKEYDIEVSYKKIRGDDRIDFHITSHKKRDFNPVAVLNLNQTINPETRESNRIQRM
jgi:plasmid replication initiation protein